MNMSGQYSGPYYHPFGPPNEGFGQSNQYRHPFPQNNPRNYNPMYPPNYPPPQIFAEYSLWGNSSYNPTDLIRPNSGMFGHHHPSPPYPPPFHQYPPPVHFRPECPPPHIPDPPDVVPESLPPENPPEVPPEITAEVSDEPEKEPLEVETQIEDEPVFGSDEPELTGLEEPEKVVIDKEELYKCSDNDSDGSDDDSTDTADQASNSSGSGSDWTSSNFQRSSYPPARPWASRPARVVNNRGRKSNTMQRRLVMALSQPVKFDKGASMMQRMGWMGGGLGRDGDGIVDPIAPNATYATSSVGFGQETTTTKKTKKTKQKEPQQNPKKAKAKKNREVFKTNVLQLLLNFVKNDLLLELYFDSKLTNIERMRIHKLVAGLEGREKTENVDTTRQQEMVNEIHRRNKYTLSTHSDGEGAERQICVYKSAPDHMFLVTPDDCRPCTTEIKEIEEENPFLKSITKHIRPDAGTILQPRAPHLFDKLLQYFMEFCTDDLFTEFRFLGPFTRKETYVINNFFSLIGDLSQKQKPYFKVPVELLDVFATPSHRFHKDDKPNGFTAIRKEAFNLREEFEKQEEEKRKKRALDHHPANLLARKILTSKIT